jgi:adenylosuccinate synthase
MSKHVPIVIVQGAQWGSEAKGAVAAFLCQKRNIALAVRTGAVNAGHTVYWPDANPDGIGCKMQQLPVGWVNPTTKLVLGAGTFVHPEILASEIEWVSKWTGEDIRERLYIDYRASIHLPNHQEQAKVMDRHHLIGATGKGCSVAITDKITNRGRGYKLFKEWIDTNVPIYSSLDRLQFVDTQEMIHAAYDDGQSIQLEGTQGSLLDLHLGPYPYTTHKQTSAANWVTECGLAPGMEYETILVARTYPIRVAGNSGPMPQETTWPNLAREINRKLMNRRFPQRVKSYAIQDFETALHELANSGKFLLPKHRDGSPNFDMHLWMEDERVIYSHALSELNAATLSRLSGPVLSELMNLFELTTVTKKLRRIAQWDPATVARQCKYNRADSVVLTFFNYWYPETWNITASKFEWLPEYKRRVKVLEDEVGCQVSYITTGPGSEHVIPTLR